MERSFAVSQGIWRVEQDCDSLEVFLIKYGNMIDHWKGEKIYTFEELHDILIKESYKRRQEK